MTRREADDDRSGAPGGAVGELLTFPSGGGGGRGGGGGGGGGGESESQDAARVQRLERIEGKLDRLLAILEKK